MRFGKGLVSRSPVVLLLFVLSLFFCTGSFAAGGHNAHWGYEGEEGPEHWAGISEEYKACSSGKSQSPVDIKDAAGADLKAITFNYKSSRINILNNGHTVQVNYDEGSSIEVDGVKYDLLQFHFHGPSEHTVKGEFSDMEMHLVHRDKDGNLAVVGVMMEVGTENEALSGLALVVILDTIRYYFILRRSPEAQAKERLIFHHLGEALYILIFADLALILFYLIRLGLSPRLFDHVLNLMTDGRISSVDFLIPLVLGLITPLALLILPRTARSPFGQLIASCLIIFGIFSMGNLVITAAQGLPLL